MTALVMHSKAADRLRTPFARTSGCNRPALAILLFLLILPARQTPAQTAAAVLPTITTARAAHSLTQGEASRAYPVRLRGVVTYYDNTIDPGSPRLFVLDSSGSVYVALTTVPVTPLLTGDLVEITGITAAGQFAPIIDHATSRFLRKSHLPAIVPRVTATAMLDGATDGQWVEVEGVVHGFRRYGPQVFLDLWMADGVLTAFTVFDPSADYASLVDATIAIRGNAAPLFNAMGQMTGAHIIFPGMATVTIEQPAHSDPFHLTVTRISDILRYTPRSGLQHRMHIRGSLILLWPGKLICVQDDSRDLCAETQQTDPLRVGQIVDILGFPSIGEFFPTLDHAIYRATQHSNEPIPSALTFDQALNPATDAKLITVEGKLINENSTGDEASITLSSGSNIFTAVLPKSLVPTGGLGLEYGSLFRVTGICKIQSDGQGNTTGLTPVAKSFTIMERSVADLVLIERASWWNATHTLAALALALCVTLIAFCGLFVLRRRVKEQTATIRAQLAETNALKEAAEFQASHDGLTGLFNRKAIFDLLQREAGLAARSGTPTGIIMLDLDHFKRINDNHGHAAGDDVIREVVHRILLVVRSSDWVGRYGGEEFIIVLPGSGDSEVRACAERIRSAICAGSISAEGTFILATASLGATTAAFPLHSTHQAIVAADLALYDAKNNGRNQVAFRDPGQRSPRRDPIPPPIAGDPVPQAT